MKFSSHLPGLSNGNCIKQFKVIVMLIAFLLMNYPAGAVLLSSSPGGDEAMPSVTEVTFLSASANGGDLLIFCPDNMVIPSTDPLDCTWKAPAGTFDPLFVISDIDYIVSWDVTNPDQTVTQGLNTLNGYLFSKGVSQVGITVSQIGSDNTWHCQFTVTVIDSEAPRLNCTHCPPAVVLSAGGDDCSATHAPELTYWDTWDNCTVFYSLKILFRVYRPDYSVSIWLENGTEFEFEKGISQVEWKITDEAGNSVSCYQQVTVADGDEPGIICPSDEPLVREISPDMCGYEVVGNEFDAEATGTCSLVSLTHDYPSWNAFTLAGAVFPVGTTIVTWTAVYDTGEELSCSVTVVVEDNVPPVFVNCPEGQEYTISLFPGECVAGAIWSIPVATDNCGLPTVAQVEGPEPGDPIAAGSYVVTYRAADDFGNEAFCSFTLTVIDTEGPLVVCPGNELSFNTDPGMCTWTAPPNSLSPLLANSNCPARLTYTITGATTAEGEDDASGQSFNIGESLVSYTITDTEGGQSWTCSFVVIVTDNEAPSIAQCAPAIVQDSDPGMCGAEISLSPPEVHDNCSTDDELVVTYFVYGPDNSISGPFAPDDGAFVFLAGTSQVEWEIADAAGNLSWCRQAVSILPVLPEVNAGPDVTICAGESFQLEGTASNYHSVEWTSTGSGMFDPDPYTLDAVYIPGNAEIITGQVQLSLIAHGFDGCPGNEDVMILTLHPPATANAGPDAFTCENAPFLIAQASATHYLSLHWTHNGQGELLEANTLHPTYIPHADDALADGVVLSLTVVSSGPCPDITDQMTLFVSAQVAADAGSDQTLFDQTTTELDAADPLPGVGVWTQVFGPTVPHIEEPDNPKTVVSELAEGIYAFRWTVTNSPCDPYSDIVIVTVINTADLAITKTISNDNPGPGDELTYTVEVVNLGPSAAENVVVTDFVPAGLSLLDVQVTAGSWTTPLWTIGTLQSGATARLVLKVLTGNLPAGMELVNMASLQSSTSDPDGSNNADEAVAIVAARPEMLVVKAAGTDEEYVMPGQEFVYTIDLLNTGNVALTDITVTDMLPAYLDFVSANQGGTYNTSTGEVSWNIALLAMEEQLTLEVHVVVSSDAVHLAELVNIAVAISGPTGPVTSDPVSLVVIRPLALDIDKADVLCYGDRTGSATVIMLGGLPPYTVVWSTHPVQMGFTAYFLAAGTYMVEVTDALGSTEQMEVVIGQPEAPLFAQSSVSPVLCNGQQNGAVTLNVSGGTPPYAYKWSNGATTKDLVNIGAGTYQVEVSDANGCLEILQIVVPEQPELMLTDFMVIPVLCKEDSLGSVSLFIAGGTPPYQFLWSNGLTVRNLVNMPGGEYSVRVTDSNGCTLDLEFAIGYQYDDCELRVPEGISMDGDGINDIWRINGLQRFPENMVQVFNRWGTLVYEASPFLNDWDGVPNRGRVLTEPDGKLPTGTYYWILRLDPAMDPLSGYIYLVR